MRLKNQKHGPVTLRNIEHSPRMSEETFSFVAEISINGKKSVVRNDGRGGMNLIQGFHLDEDLKEYCDTLPPLAGTDLDINPDFLISLMIENGIKEHYNKPQRRKKNATKTKPSAVTTSFKVGDKVSFGRPNGEQTVGVVEKINRKSVKVKTVQARGSRAPAGAVWRVHPSLITKVQ